MSFFKSQSNCWLVTIMTTAILLGANSALFGQDTLLPGGADGDATFTNSATSKNYDLSVNPNPSFNEKFSLFLLDIPVRLTNHQTGKQSVINNMLKANEEVSARDFNYSLKYYAQPPEAKPQVNTNLYATQLGKDLYEEAQAYVTDKLQLNQTIFKSFDFSIDLTETPSFLKEKPKQELPKYRYRRTNINIPSTTPETAFNGSYEDFQNDDISGGNPSSSINSDYGNEMDNPLYYSQEAEVEWAIEPEFDDDGNANENSDFVQTQQQHAGPQDENSLKNYLPEPKLKVNVRPSRKDKSPFMTYSFMDQTGFFQVHFDTNIQTNETIKTQSITVPLLINPGIKLNKKIDKNGKIASTSLLGIRHHNTAKYSVNLHKAHVDPAYMMEYQYNIDAHAIGVKSQIRDIEKRQGFKEDAKTKFNVNYNFSF